MTIPSTPIRRLLLGSAFVLGSLLPLSGCKGFETNLQDTEVDYKPTARTNFEAGMEALKGERYNASIKFFEYVKNKFPYSKYAVLADLRVADAHFGREKWLEAADSYRLFVRFHPRHEQVPYALFHVAKAYNNAIGEDIFLFPPAREKDQEAAQDAVRAFDEFLERYPKHPLAKEAIALRVKARTRLADHDLYAAKFYAQREKWRGAIFRYDRIATDFSDTPLAASALFEMARITDEELGDPKEAGSIYKRLLKEHPDSKEAAEVTAKLGG